MEGEYIVVGMIEASDPKVLGFKVGNPQLSK